MTARRIVLVAVNIAFGFMLAALWEWPDGRLIVPTKSPESFALADLIPSQSRSEFISPATPGASDQESASPDIKVMGILINGNRRVALVLADGESGPQRVSEGDRVKNRRIVEIRTRSIAIGEAGTRLELPLDRPRSAP